MPSYKKYMAASVPRFLRQTKLAYLPSRCVIGSHITYGAGGINLYFDIIMLPEPEFQRMKSNVGLQHVIAPGLNIGPTFAPGFVLANAKHIAVPIEEHDPESYAKNYFLKEFGLSDGEPVAETPQAKKSNFMTTARECTVKGG